MRRRLLGNRRGGINIGTPIENTNLINLASLRTYHKFENSALLVDSSGNGRNAIENISTSFSQTNFGRGAKFNGTTSTIRLHGDSVINGAFTVMFWGKLDTETTPNVPCFFSIGDFSTSWGVQCSLYNDGTATPQSSRFFIVSSTNGLYSANKGYTLVNFPFNILRHYAYTFSGSLITQYINGVKVNEASTPSITIRGISQGKYIGRFTSANHLSGEVSDFATFGEALTQQQIQLVV